MTFGCQNFLDSVAADVWVWTCSQCQVSVGTCTGLHSHQLCSSSSPRESLVQLWHIPGNNSLLLIIHSLSPLDLSSPNSQFLYPLFLLLFVARWGLASGTFVFCIQLWRWWSIKDWWFSPSFYFTASLGIHFYSTSTWIARTCNSTVPNLLYVGYCFKVGTIKLFILQLRWGPGVLKKLIKVTQLDKWQRRN